MGRQAWRYGPAYIHRLTDEYRWVWKPPNPFFSFSITPTPPISLTTKSCAHTTATASHLTVGAASLPGPLPPHSFSPPPPCSPDRRCRLLAWPAASSLAQPTASLLTRSPVSPPHPARCLLVDQRPTIFARPPPPGHRLSPPGHCSWRSRATAARCHHRHRCLEGRLLLSQPPQLAPTARPPTPRGPPPVCWPWRCRELRWGLNPLKFCILNKKFEC
jgi:hypothetical protein